MGEDGARGRDWLRARGHHLCLTDTILKFSLVIRRRRSERMTDGVDADERDKVSA